MQPDPLFPLGESCSYRRTIPHGSIESVERIIRKMGVRGVVNFFMPHEDAKVAANAITILTDWQITLSNTLHEKHCSGRISPNKSALATDLGRYTKQLSHWNSLVSRGKDRGVNLSLI